MLIPKNKGNDLFFTPPELAKQIISHYNPKGICLEPCFGEGAFYNAMPEPKDWCEITKGRDFFEYDKKVDWIITNPPFSLFRAFLNKSMDVADNIIFLTTINHFWLKARIRDIIQKGFTIKEIWCLDTPKTFPQSGFQVGCVYLSNNKGVKNCDLFLGEKK
jgi:hypothetical protein